MRAAVVIRTRDEAPRLALTLASLEAQEGLDAVVVADDGSTDDTPAVLAAAQGRLPLLVVRHDTARGRAAASNAAADRADADLLIFLDGDTLAGPGLVAAHRRANAGDPVRLARGETWHLRCTRFLADPDRGTPQPAEAARLAALAPAEREAMRVTATQVRDDFAAVARRAMPGVYPGAGPRRLHEIEIAALRRAAPHSWAAASGSNFSVPAALFAAVGGFDPAIDINEHRELAYRCQRAGAAIAVAEGARSYHLTHRTGWRDPLHEIGWEAHFRARHPDAPLDALMAFWLGLQDGVAPDFFA